MNVICGKCEESVDSSEGREKHLVPNAQSANTSQPRNDVSDEEMNEICEISGRGICHIETATGLRGGGALYELLPGVHTLMTSHHVIPTADVTEVTLLNYL